MDEVGEARAVIRDLLDEWPEGWMPSGPLCVRAANVINANPVLAARSAAFSRSHGPGDGASMGEEGQGDSVGLQPSSRPSTAIIEADDTGADLLRRARTELYGLCEAVQDDAHNRLEAPGLTDVERAYLRGQKHEAKGIARAMGDVFRDLITTAEEARL